MTSESGGATRPQADAVAMMRYDANKKTALVGYLLWFFLGLLGAHRFYFGRTGSAVAMLLLTIFGITLVVSMIWVLVDAFLIPGMARDYNNNLVTTLTR